MDSVMRAFNLELTLKGYNNSASSSFYFDSCSELPKYSHVHRTSSGPNSRALR